MLEIAQAPATFWRVLWIDPDPFDPHCFGFRLGASRGESASFISQFYSAGVARVPSPLNVKQHRSPLGHEKCFPEWPSWPVRICCAHHLSKPSYFKAAWKVLALSIFDDEDTERERRHANVNGQRNTLFDVKTFLCCVLFAHIVLAHGFRLCFGC